jgi:drug/metabolite transporter (DMT)-like permease
MAIKVSVGEAPFIMAAARFFLAASFLVVYQKIRGKAIFPKRSDKKVILALGFGNFFFGYGLTYWGMQFVNSNITSILWATMPVMIAVFAHRMLANEKINAWNIFSLAGALIGTVIIFDVQGESFDTQTAKGMAMILVSVLAAAYPNVLYKKQGGNLDPVAANAAAMFIGATLLLSVGIFTDPWQSKSVDLLTVGATTYLALFGSAIGFTLYFWLLNRVTVVKMSYSTFLIPILASVWGWLVLGETLSKSNMIGGLIILLAVSVPEMGRFTKKKVLPSESA